MGLGGALCKLKVFPSSSTQRLSTLTMDQGRREKSREENDRDRTKCPKCQTSLHKRSLDRHLATEHGPRVYYWCRHCAHKNNRRDNLKAHYRDCHPDRMEEVREIECETY